MTEVFASVEIVYVGSAGHLRRYKAVIVDADGNRLATDLFKTQAEADAFIARHGKETR